VAKAHLSPSGTDRRLVITGMGHYFPPEVLSNEFFESLDIGALAAWTYERVGIRQRHSVLRAEDVRQLRQGLTSRQDLVNAGRIATMAEMCREPCQLARTRSVQASVLPDIDLVIAGTSVPDWDIPANACSIAAGLGLECAAFDVNSACSSFVVDLHAARGLMLSGMAKSVAVFNAERYTTRLDFSDRGSCMLFGDAATAAILSADVAAHGLELIDTIVESSPVGFQSVRIADGDTFKQNGAAVQRFAVTKTVAVTRQLLERHDLTPSDLAYFVGHQANFRMLTSACDRLGITSAQHLHNVEMRGNQGGAGAPAVLSTNWDRFEVGDLIAVAVVGSGLTWGAALLRRV